MKFIETLGKWVFFGICGAVSLVLLAAALGAAVAAAGISFAYVVDAALKFFK